MKEYVVGIITDQDNRILLVRKNRPENQVGKLNGVGGLIEKDESPYEAIIRECKEECNLCLTNWLKLGVLFSDESKVYFFSSRASTFSEAKPLTDEAIEIIGIDALPYDQVVSPTDAFIRIHVNPMFKSIKIEKR